MDFKQLQALAAIADHHSFSDAAVALGTVQSNVSGRIARLEAELNTELVNRSDGRLTESGQAVLVRARRIISEVAAVATDVLALDSDVRGVVNLGFIGTTGRWLVPQLLEFQRERLPLIQLRISEGTNASLEPRLAQGELDLAVLSRPVLSSELHDSELFSEDLVLIVPAEHAFARAGVPITLEQLASIDLLLPLTGTIIRNEIDAAAERAGVRLRTRIELDGLRTLASLTFDGYGPAVLPATALPEHLRGAFVPIQITGLPPRHVALAVRRYGFPAASVRATRQLLFRLVSEATSLPAGVHPLADAESR
jgi:DNA-binding transcriptional LysR family regulator